MAIQTNFPALKPTLLLDFANVEALDPRVTFARASEGRFYGTQTAKAEENLLVQSQTFDNAAWTKGNTSVTANTEVAPDGTTTAETLTATAATNFHIVIQTSASTTGTTRTFSLFAKKGTHNFVQLYFNADTNVFANFNLDAGTVGTVGSASTATITNVGNDWYRCVMTTSSATANNVAVIAMISSATAARAESWTTLGTETVFIWGAQLEQRSAVTAYTPTTDQPITNYIPVLQTAASGVARFDHNPTTFESLGLLIEEQRTNLVTYSEQFDNASWTKVTSVVTANTIVAPDGTLTGEKLVLNNSETAGYVSQSNSYTSGTAYTFSCYAKQGEQTDFRIFTPVSAFGSSLQGVFNLSTGTVTSFTATSASITNVGNGWYRCSITATATSTTTGFSQFRTQYTGDGYSGIYIWGAQLEAGAFPTSYIPTVASQVTRSADAASMTGANFSSWFSNAEGTLYAESRCPNGIASNLNRIASLNDGTASNRMEIDTGSAAATAARIVVNGTSQGQPTAGSYTDFQLRKSALAIQVDNFTLAANTATNSDTSALVPVVNRLLIGQSPASSSIYLNGTMAKLAYYPKRLTNAEIVALTS